MKKRILSLFFCIVLAVNFLCPLTFAEEGYYTSQTQYTSDALFQIIGPDNAVAQYFKADFNTLESVKIFTYSDNPNTKYILSIRNSYDDATNLYTEEFTKPDTDAKWFTMQLSSSVNITKGEKYCFVINSAERAVVNGSATLGDTSGGEPECRTYSYDSVSRPDSPWALTMQRLAFEVTGTETDTAVTNLINAIDSLPEEFILSDLAAIASVAEAKDNYFKLSDEQKTLITNFSKLQDSIEKVEELYTDNSAAYYNSNTEVIETALFLITATNNAAGQYFVPGFNRIGAVKIYTETTEENTVYTLRICTDPMDTNTDIYTGTFTKKEIGLNWFTMTLSTPVSVIKGEKYAYVISTDKRGVIYGDAEGMGNAPYGAINYDERAYGSGMFGGWDFPNLRTGFKVIGAHYSISEVIGLIDSLPLEITKDSISDVKNAQSAYSGLLETEKFEITNYAKLEAAVAAAAVLEKQALMEEDALKLDTDIEKLPAIIALTDENDIVKLETKYNELCTLYGEEFKLFVKNYSVLVSAREALDELKNAIKYGDIDGNGDITASDALLALQYSVDKITLDEKQIKAGDVDLKAGISASDALLILQYSVYKIDSFPVEQIK